MTSSLPMDAPAPPHGARSAALGLLIALATGGLMAATVWYVKREVSHIYTARPAGIAKKAHTEAQAFIDAELRGLTDVAEVFVKYADVPKEEFNEASRRATERAKALSSLNFVDNGFIVRRVYPYAAGRTAIGLNLKSRFDVVSVANRALSTKRTSATDVVDLVQGGRGMLFYSPVTREGRWVGHVEGVMRIDDVIRALSGFIGPGYDYTIVDETSGRQVYSSFPPGVYERTTPFDAYFTLRLADRSWWIVIHPKSSPYILLPLVVLLLAELGLGAFLIIKLLRNQAA